MRNRLWIVLAALVPLVAQTGDVSGKIINAVTGEPMKGATFTLRQGKQEFAATTNEKGEFTVPAIAPGAYVRAPAR